MSEQITELQDIEQMAKEEKEKANKWHNYYKSLEQEYSEALHISAGHCQRADKAKQQINEMAQAIEEAALKAQKDAQEIKDL